MEQNSFSSKEYLLTGRYKKSVSRFTISSNA